MEIRRLQGLFAMALAASLALSAAATPGCGGTANQILITAGVIGDATGMVAAADAELNGVQVTDAAISINGTPLTFGLPIAFATEGGLAVSETIPMYFADLTGVVAPGQTATLTANSAAGTLIYSSGPLTVPGLVALTSPAEGAQLAAGADVAMSWSEASDAIGYAAGYEAPDAFDGAGVEDNDPDGEYTGDDPGLYLTFTEQGVTPTMTSATIPAANLLAGAAEFSVAALNATATPLGGDYSGSLFVAGTYDAVEAAIADGAVQAIGEKQLGAQQDLGIVKEYEKSEQGYTFKVRETNPQQITAPGTIQLNFKMRRFKVSIAFIKAFDMNGAEYFSWTEKRIMKSHEKKVHPAFAAQPGTTVVFGTHDASYRGGTYTN